ncbi:hypothetical protein [Methylocystis parvus]|uniref:hypothetical protein n=1 Tax=Methylocystis parvus TaxID=134 RepID=UPI003C759BA7
MTAHNVEIDAARSAVVQLRPRYLRKAEAAKYIGCGASKLAILLAEGVLEARRADKLVLVSVASLDAYLDSLPNARDGQGAANNG